MQIDPIIPTLKAPGSNRLKLKYDQLVSSFAFKFNLRRYTVRKKREGRERTAELEHLVGRCRLNR